MAWVQINRDFDWRPAGHTTIAFLAGMRVPVTHDALAAIIEAEAGVEIPAPPRPDPETADAAVSDPSPVGVEQAPAGADGEGPAEPGQG